MLQYKIAKTNLPREKWLVYKALPKEQADKLLIEGGCHVDHEGFDLNEIEQEYLVRNKVALTKDPTWYKDGEGTQGANAVIYPWIEQAGESDLIIDHSHIVIRYPLFGEALDQVKEYSERRPELLRILSAQYKCGLDLCIDFMDTEAGRVEPIVHIEWDYESIERLNANKLFVEEHLATYDWTNINKILKYNQYARINKLEAFEQANTRAQLFFNLPHLKAYQLIPTI